MLAAGLAVLFTPPASAFVASKAACQGACGPAIARACNGYGPNRYRRCRAHLVRQCRQMGVAAVCPAASPTTTTAPPPPVTTTTAPRPTTTTTTLPPPPPVVNLTGNYEFDGYITYDDCGVVGLGVYMAVPFSVTAQSGTNLAGYQGANNIPVTHLHARNQRLESRRGLV